MDDGVSKCPGIEGEGVVGVTVPGGDGRIASDGGGVRKYVQTLMR